MIRRLVLTLTLAIAVSAQATDWNADLQLLRREVPKMHPNAFHATTREAFEASIEKLKEEAPSLPPHVVVARIAKIVASIGDGHTRLTLPVDPNSGFFLGHTTTPLPADDASEALADIIGARDDALKLLAMPRPYQFRAPADPEAVADRGVPPREIAQLLNRQSSGAAGSDVQAIDHDSQTPWKGWE